MTSLSPDIDAYDFWFDPKVHIGEDAIVLDDDWRVLPDAIRAEFATVTLADTIKIERFGKVLDVHRIYIGKDFKPAKRP